MEKIRESRRTSISALLTSLNPLTVWIATNWETPKEMGIPAHLTCLLRNRYAGHEATVRTGHGTTDWFHIGKGVHQGCVLSPCLFNLYAEYIMWNARLDEAQAGIKIARRTINNLRYADDTTLMSESKKELKSLFLCVCVFAFYFLFIYFFPFTSISWRLITLQYCSGFCHTLTWISHGVSWRASWWKWNRRVKKLA